MQAADDIKAETPFRMTPPWSRLVVCPASGSIRRSAQQPTSLALDNERSEVQVLDPRGCARHTSSKSVREDLGSASQNGNLVPSQQPSSKDIVLRRYIFRPPTAHRHIRHGSPCQARYQ